MNQSINHKAVYRTAPATPGLLNICHQLKAKTKVFFCPSFRDCTTLPVLQESPTTIIITTVIIITVAITTITITTVTVTTVTVATVTIN